MLIVVGVYRNGCPFGALIYIESDGLIDIMIWCRYAFCLWYLLPPQGATMRSHWRNRDLGAMSLGLLACPQGEVADTVAEIQNETFTPECVHGYLAYGPSGYLVALDSLIVPRIGYSYLRPLYL